MLLLLFSIASSKVVAFNLLCFNFGIISLLLFLIYPSNVIALPTISIRIVVGLIAKRNGKLFAIPLKNKKAMQKMPCTNLQSDTKNEAKRLRARIFAITM